MTAHVDDDGHEVNSGDWISFCYGIPPVAVHARLSKENGEMIATVFGKHRPRKCNLRDLRHYVGPWYRSNDPS